MNAGHLRGRTVRLSPRIDEAVREAAQQDGVTVSQFIREAVLARLTWRWALDEPEQAQALEKALRDIRDGTI